MASTRPVSGSAKGHRTRPRQVAERPPRLDVTGRPVELRHIDLDSFFHPATVCVVGASDSGNKPNTNLTVKITKWGESRGAKVVYVNPLRPLVAGRRCARSLAEVAEPIDLVAILVGDPIPVVRQAIEAGARFAVVFAAGFAEVGGKGERLQAELEELVRSSSLHVLGPNTNLNAFELFREDLPGKAIALVTQSGHQGRPVYQGQEIGIKLSHWAPVGNEADLEVADFIGYFAGLSTTGAIACYVEGFKNGRTFQLAADRAARMKVPVVTVKVGRTQAGTSMAKAHTGHLTGSDRVVSAAFRQYGVVRVDGLDQLLEVAATLARTKAPSESTMRRLASGKPGRVCVYSISGGTGAHMADLVAAAGMELPELTPHTQRTLRQWIPSYLRVSNPVDNGGPPVRDERGPKILNAIVADPRVDLILCPITGALASMANKLTSDLVAAAARTDKPMLVVWGSPTGDEPAYTENLLGSTVPTFRTFTNAVLAAKAYFDHHRFARRYRSAFSHPPMRPSPAAKSARALLTGELSGGRSLDETRSKQLLAQYGIELPEEVVAHSAAEAARAAERIGYPVVMKVSSPDILHKSDLGLVRTSVRSATEAKSAYKELVASASANAPGARLEGVLVAEQVSGVETVLGMAHDELFGPVVMFGMGGVFVEVLGDVTFRVPPFGRRDAEEMLGELAGARLLSGVRGRPPADRFALVESIMAMQQIALDLGDLVSEVDVNPLMAGPSRAVAADALIVMA